MTPRERMVFELRHYQGLRLRAIGEMLGTSEEAAKNCLFRATQKMRCGVGRFRMNCDRHGKIIPLYFYGELPPEEEERVEDHLDGCEACRGELERLRSLAAALDRREMPVPAALLSECRDDLMAAIRSGAALPRLPAAAHRGPSLGERFSALGAALWGLRQPIGAMALLAVGYFSAQLTPARIKPAVVDPAEPMVARVRSVQPDASGPRADFARRSTEPGGLRTNGRWQYPAAAAVRLARRKRPGRAGGIRWRS